jgi:hypothetical protein
MDAVNLAAAVATIAALLLAMWQYAEGRRRTRTEKERLAAQSERLRLFADAAIGMAETIDHIVQRTKEDDVTWPEIRSLARASRRQATGLVQQLRDEDALLRDLPVARTVVSAAGPGGRPSPGKRARRRPGAAATVRKRPHRTARPPG